MENREAIIRNYIEGYNQFDIDRMVKDFSNEIIFRNISNGEVNLSTKGCKAFREQAEKAATYFSKRTQSIKRIWHENDKSEVEIEYNAVLAIDLPNGLKKGEEMHLTGKSIFEFRGTKITSLTDLS